MPLSLHVVERPVHDDGKFVKECRFETGKAILAHADQLLTDGLMRSALRCEGDAGPCVPGLLSVKRRRNGRKLGMTVFCLDGKNRSIQRGEGPWRAIPIFTDPVR